MTDDGPAECPECGSTEVAEQSELEEYVCESCGYVVATEQEESDSVPEWRAFGETERWEEQRRRRAERKSAYQEAVEQRESAPEPPRTWGSSFGSLLTCQDGIAYLYGEEEICAIEADTGDCLWETKVENLATPSSVGLLVPSSNVLARVNIGPDAIVVQTQERDIVGIDTATGERLWRRSLTETFDGRMSADGDRVYVAGKIGQLQTLDIETGETLWSVTDSYTEAGSSLIPPLLVTDNLVISTVNTHDGWVLAREKTSGNDRWRFALRETPTLLIKTTEDRILAPTYAGDVFALDLNVGTQDWRYRLPEYDDRQEKITPRTPVISVVSPGSYHLVTGEGFYAGLVDSTNGEEVLELSSVGDELISDSEPIFNTPPLVFDDGSITVTFAGQVARAYNFANEVEDEDSARRWYFQAQDRSRVEPVAVDERYMAIPDRNKSLCLLEVRGGEANAHIDLETSINAVDETDAQLVVETTEGIVSFDCS